MATRKLSSSINPNKYNIEINIGIPEREFPGTWRCAFQIFYNDKKIIKYAYGIDAIQSLINSFSAIRTTMNDLQINATWEGAFPEDLGDHGFPYVVPYWYGLNFSKKIEQLIDTELSLFNKNIF